MREDGTIPARYDLQEQNVVDSDGTVIFSA